MSVYTYDEIKAFVDDEGEHNVLCEYCGDGESYLSDTTPQEIVSDLRYQDWRWSSKYHGWLCFRCTYA